MLDSRIAIDKSDVILELDPLDRYQLFLTIAITFSPFLVFQNGNLMSLYFPANALRTQ